MKDISAPLSSGFLIYRISLPTFPNILPSAGLKSKANGLVLLHFLVFRLIITPISNSFEQTVFWRHEMLFPFALRIFHCCPCSPVEGSAYCRADILPSIVSTAVRTPRVFRRTFGIASDSWRLGVSILAYFTTNVTAFNIVCMCICIQHWFYAYTTSHAYHLIFASLGCILF